MASFYGLKIENFSTECLLAKTTLSRLGDKPESVHSVYIQLLTLQAAFPSLIKLLKIALTLAVSTAQCERSFSALKRIKTYLRTTMSEQRLTDIALISIERDLSDQISFDNVLEHFENGDVNTTILLS